MTDLSIFRVYEPHECKNGRYPYAWDDLGDGRGIKDLVREEAGHRCIRCAHPFKVGETGEYEREEQPGVVLDLPRNVSFDGLLEAHVAATRGRGIHWSACDEQCTHIATDDAPVRMVTPVGIQIVGSDGEEYEAGFVRQSLSEDIRVEAAWRILTVHHLNERKFDCRWHNLVSLCQRCHLVIQRKVEMNQVWPFEHSEWFKPYAAAFYAYSYLGQELTREETMARLDELLALERVA